MNQEEKRSVVVLTEEVDRWQRFHEFCDEVGSAPAVGGGREALG
jgi:hypothetical protein